MAIPEDWLACLEVGVFELWKAAQSTGEILESGIPPYTAYRRPASSTRPMPGRPDNNLASRTLECMLKPAVRRRGREAGRASSWARSRPCGARPASSTSHRTSPRRRGAPSRPRVCSSRPCHAQADRASSWARNWPGWAHAPSSACAIPGTTCRALPPRDDDRFGRANQLEEAFDLPTLVLDEVQTLSAVCEERYRVSLPMRDAGAFLHKSKMFGERERGN